MSAIIAAFAASNAGIKLEPFPPFYWG